MKKMLFILFFIPFVIFAGVFSEDNKDEPYQLQAAGPATAFLWNTQTGDVWFIVAGDTPAKFQDEVKKYYAKHQEGYDKYGNLISISEEASRIQQEAERIVNEANKLKD